MENVYFDGKMERLRCMINCQINNRYTPSLSSYSMADDAFEFHFKFFEKFFYISSILSADVVFHVYFQAAALAMDESVLDADQVENLIKFCPTKEEMELLKVR